MFEIALLAELFVVMARHPDTKKISAFIVERDWPGVSTRETEHKLGIWAGSTGELFFENVEVPAENLIGEEGMGFTYQMMQFQEERLWAAGGGKGSKATLTTLAIFTPHGGFSTGAAQRPGLTAGRDPVPDSAPARPAPPQSGAADCTWRCDRCGWRCRS